MGDSGASLAGLSAMFNNPLIYGCLPCKHNYTQTGEYIFSGFFIPAYRLHFSFLDDRGVTDEEKAKAQIDAKKAEKTNDPQAYLEYCSEYCYTPEDALIRQGENLFNQVLLSEQLAQIKIHKTVKLPVRGTLMGGTEQHPLIVFKPGHEDDCLTWVLEEPMKGENGETMANLYCAGIDSIDVGKNDSTGLLDVSDFCITIMRRQNGIKPPCIVAMYKYRPNDIRSAYAEAIRLMEWYNCKCVLESTRTNIITYAREKKKLHLFMTRPRATISNLKTNTTMIGTPATEGVIRHYLLKIEEFVNDYSDTIAFPEIIDQLLRYSYEEKRKFDIVAAMGMMLLADEELYAVPIKVVDEYKKEWRDIGYFRDRTGKMHYGAIPKGDELEYYHLR